MKLLTVRHATTYRYARPVTFGCHRLMLRPRDSHDLRLVGAALSLAPACTVRWMHDVFGNSVALVDFTEPAAELCIISTLTIERYALARPDFPIAQEAESYPFVYSANDRSDLGRLVERHYPDPRSIVDEWAKHFILEMPTNTFNLLATINAAMLEGTVCCAQVTPPFPASSKNAPMTAALRHWTRRGRGAPISRINV